MNHKKYRVSYNQWGLGIKAGINGYLDWDEDNFYFIDSKNNLTTIALKDLIVGPHPREKQLGSIESNFLIKNKQGDFAYAIGFIGSKDDSVLGIAQDYKEHSKTFVSFIATKIPNPDPRFKADGTFDHRKSNIIFILLLLVFAVLFIVLSFIKVYFSSHQENTLPANLREQFRCDRMTQEVLNTDKYCNDYNLYKKDHAAGII